MFLRNTHPEVPQPLEHPKHNYWIVEFDGHLVQKRQKARATRIKAASPQSAIAQFKNQFPTCPNNLFIVPESTGRIFLQPKRRSKTTSRRR